MFYYDDGLWIDRPRFAIDVCRGQRAAFISHAHGDHIARHGLTYATPITINLLQHRLGVRNCIALPCGVPHDLPGVQLTTYPAGHILGSAMLLVSGAERLLYTGDFKLGPSATAEPAEVPRADILIMESSFGDPRFRWPPRETVVDQLINTVGDAITKGVFPVIRAYSLGKAQEVTRILTAAGLAVTQHPVIAAMSAIYEASGCSLGNYDVYGAAPETPSALIFPPRTQKAGYYELPTRTVRIAVTGWAATFGSRHQLDVDHAIPLSDHADFDELLQCIDMVEPKQIYCTHGPTTFVDHLRSLGLPAQVLGAKTLA